MNRRDRRAAEKRQQTKKSSLNVPPQDASFDALPATMEFGLNPQSGDGLFLSGDLRHEPPKPKLFTRLLAKVLLSRWVLKRVQHPDVERLLISFATEAGRTDIADELVRRQLTRP
jgi:hypothetical protein